MSMSKIEGVKAGAALVLAATAILGSSTQAAALPPAYLGVSLYDLGITNTPGSYSGVSQSGGFESASLTGFPQPALTASGSGDVEGMVSGGGGQIYYYFEVVGPESDTPVNLQITGSLVVRNLTANGGARAYLSAGGLNKSLEIYSPGEMQWSSSWLTSVSPGSLNLVEMGVTAGGADYDGAYNSYAFADPIISFVGPHDGYSLVFSPGIGNGAGPGVPEPATWAMMVVGFGALGAVLRRRSRSALAA